MLARLLAASFVVLCVARIALADEAYDRYQSGEEHYKLGEFDEAVQDYKAAYKLSKQPGLLFNIAQAYRLMNDYERARYFYNTYLREVPDAENRADVEDRINEMEAALAAQPTRTGDGKTSTLTDEDTSLVTPSDDTAGKTGTDTAGGVGPLVVAPDEHADHPAASRPGRGWKIAGLGAAGGGVVLLGVSAWAASVASSASDDVTTVSRTSDTWDPPDQTTWDRGKRAEAIAITTAIVGGVALAGGGYLYYMGLKKDREAARVAVVPAPGNGALFTVAGRF